MPPESTEDQSQDDPRPPSQGKLAPEQRLSIAKRVEAGEKQIALASEFGVTRQAISLLVQKYRRDGEEAILGARRGRKPSRKLAPEEEEAIRRIVAANTTPAKAGLESGGKGKDTWDADAIKQLIKRECSFSPTKGTVADLLAKWDLAPRGERPFSQDYYDYINSDIGKEVSRRNWELREKQLRERRDAEQAEGTGGDKQPATAGGAQPVSGAADLGGDDGGEELDYTDEELAAIRRQMLANRSVGTAVGRRTGKHSKGRGNQTPPRKKRKKRRKK